MSPGARRELTVAVGLCLTGAALVLLAAGRPWVEAVLDPGPPSPPAPVSLRGSEVTPGTSALGLLGLAGVAALLATRRAGRLVVGALLALAGTGLVALAVGAAGTDPATAVARVVDDVAVTSAAGTAWPWVAALGGLLLALAGTLAVVRGRSWAALSGRYDAPRAPGTAGAAAGEPPRRPADPDHAAWDALDRGEDPTT